MMFRSILPFLLVIMIDSIGAGILIPILGPAIMSPLSTLVALDTSLTMRYILSSMVLSSFFIFSFIATPILGHISDYYGRKRILIICSYFKSGGLLLSAFAFSSSNLILLIFSRMIVGASSANISIAQASIASASNSHNKARHLGLASMAAALGFLLGPILTGIFTNKNIVSNFSFSTPFYITACFPLIIILVLSLQKEVSQASEHMPSLRKLLSQLIDGLTETKSAKALTCLFLLSLAWGNFFLAISPFLAVEYHCNSVDIATLITYGVFIYILSATLFVALASRYFSLVQSIYIFSACIMAGSLLIFSVHDVRALWMDVALLMIGFGGCMPMLLTLLSDLHIDREQGKIMGISNSVQSFSITLSSLTIGMVSAVMTTLPFGLIIFLILCMLAMLRRG